MPVDVMPMLRAALRSLEAQRAQLDERIAALSAALTSTDTAMRSLRRARSRRKPLSSAARQAISRRMKAYWAKRRAGKGGKRPA
jgi:hypothetical protein